MEIFADENDMVGSPFLPAAAGQVHGWPVLTFHLIDPFIVDRNALSPAQFCEWLDLLQERRIPVRSLADLFAAHQAGRYTQAGLALAFDDAYQGVLEFAHPILAERGLAYTVFVPSDRVGQTNLWNPKARYLANHLTWDELRSLARAGVGIGSHGRTHHSLVKFSEEAIADELAGSRARLEAELGQPVPFVAYPYGDVNALVEQAARRVYEIGFSVSEGEWDWDRRPLAINRVLVRPGDPRPALAKILEQFYTPA